MDFIERIRKGATFHVNRVLDNLSTQETRIYKRLCGVQSNLADSSFMSLLGEVRREIDRYSGTYRDYFDDFLEGLVDDRKLAFGYSITKK